MINNAIIGQLSDRYIQPINNYILASNLGRPLSNASGSARYEYESFNPTTDNQLANGYNDIRWASAICCPNLTQLYIQYNKLSVIYLSGSTSLTVLSIQNNPYLRKLDAMTNTKLQSLLIML